MDAAPRMIASAQRTGLQIVSAAEGPRFLGLSAAERNRRVAARASHGLDASGPLPTLEVPAGVVVTPGAIAELPPASGVWAIEWDGGPPLTWRAPGALADAPDARTSLAPGAVLDVSTASARHRSAWQLLRASGKPTDAWLSRHVHRRISRLFSYLFLSIGISANAATFLVFGVGVVAAWLMAQTSHLSMIGGGFLFWLASIADGIDGEMARLTLTESAFGEQLDTAVDHATHLLGYAGVMVGWWRQGMGAAGAVVAVVAGVAVPIALLWAMALVRRASGVRDQFFVDTKPIEYGVIEAAAATGSPMLRAATVIWVILRREAFSLTFFLLALATGQRIVYPAVVVAVLVYVVLIFALYRAPIETAMRRRFASLAA